MKFWIIFAAYITLLILFPLPVVALTFILFILARHV